MPYAGSPVTVYGEVRTAPVPPATVGTLVNAGTILLRVRKPDGTFLPDYTTPVNDSTGKYHQDIPGADLATPGHYSYAWITTGTGAGAIPGVLDLDDLFGSQLLSLQDAKAYLGETGTQQDDEIRAFAQVATEVVESIVGPCTPQTFTEEVGTTGGSPVLLLSKRPVISITSITSVFGSTPTWATGALLVNKSTGVVQLLSGGSFYSGPFTVVYSAGRTVVPDKFTHAAKKMLWHLWRSQRGQTVDSPLPDFVGDEGEFTGAPSFGPGFGIPNEVRELLARDEVMGIA